MIRSARFAALLLSLTALAGCGTKTADPPKDPNAPAGDVVAIEGEVTAMRASATTSRALALDADVFADDSVTTAAGATVKIKLAHNDAVWTLGPSRTTRVDASAAWSAPKQSGGDLVLVRDDREDRTRAAARSGSQEGISSGESALETSRNIKNDEEEPKVPAAVTAMSAMRDEPKPVEPPERDSGSAPPPPDIKGLFGTETGGGSTDGFGSLGIRGSGTGGGGASENGIGLGNVGTIGHGSGTGEGYGMGSGSGGPLGGRHGTIALGNLTVTPAGRVDIVKLVVKRNFNQVRYCIERSWTTNPEMSGKLQVKFMMTADGAVTAAMIANDAKGVDDETKSCVTSRFKTWQFPAAPKGSGISIGVADVTFDPAGAAPEDAGTPAPAPSATPIQY